MNNKYCLLTAVSSSTVGGMSECSHEEHWQKSDFCLKGALAKAEVPTASDAFLKSTLFD